MISNTMIDLVDEALSRPTAAQAGATFFNRLRPFGAKAIYARAFGMPGEAPTDEHVLSRISPPGWEAIYSEKQFATVNHLPRECRRQPRPFAWSQAPIVTTAERSIMRVLRDCGFPDGLAVPCHGPLGYLGIVSLAFEALPSLAPDERAAIEVASVVMHDRLRDLSLVRGAWKPVLTPRERECIAYVADGRSDWDIADVMSISETTVVTHIQNAKRKLGSRTRAQAVAQCYLKGLF
jgi:DNA-binding CsgD family transcriptional regulator